MAPTLLSFSFYFPSITKPLVTSLSLLLPPPIWRQRSCPGQSTQQQNEDPQLHISTNSPSPSSSCLNLLQLHANSCPTELPYASASELGLPLVRSLSSINDRRPAAVCPPPLLHQRSAQPISVLSISAFCCNLKPHAPPSTHASTRVNEAAPSPWLLTRQLPFVPPSVSCEAQPAWS